MHNSQNKKTLQIVLVVLIAVLSLGIGYATISNINLIIDGNATANPNDNNFKVHFVETADTPNLEGNVALTGSADIDKDDNTMATFNVGGLTKEGDYAIATYTIINNSNDVGAKLSLELTNSNADYFKVTETITDTELQAGDTTTGTVKVEMIKSPLTNEVTTSITAKITASAVENASATGGDSASKQLPTAFASDSWATIKTNVQNGNTSQYNIGDTKEVTINGNNYTVRIANKSTYDWCDDENYSQTACGFVIEFADIVEKQVMNTYGHNSGGWPGSELYTYLEGDFYNGLPSELKTVIEPTRVISSYGCIGHYEWNAERRAYDCYEPDNNGNNFYTTDKLYLLSVYEVFGKNYTDETFDTTRQLDYYSQFGVKNYNETFEESKKGSEAWWLRTPVVNYYSTFVNIQNGRAYNYTPSGNNVGVSPAFRIG